MNDSALWQAVLGEIELSVSRANFVTWFKNTQLLSQDGAHLVVGVPNVFIKQQLERKFNDLLSDTLKKNGVVVEEIEYKIHASEARRASNEEPTLAVSEAGPKPRVRSSLTHAYRQGLNDRYTF